MLYTLAQTAEDFHAGVYRLRPEYAPLMADQGFQYRQPFIQTEQPGQLRTGQRIPGYRLQLHTILLK
ncbi:hypothetical protein D3C80_1692150 [compost metagenome]